ncbi:MAG TPA: SRPBCC family protein [Thermoanaerobaculia bacterium]|nr:SRPBCC family protein [Thermoanaerobaculia bacterium]
MKVLLVVLSLFVLVVVLVVLIGASLPKRHEASRSTLVSAPSADVYRALTDFASAPKWRPDVKRVELLDATHFREHGEHGAVTYEIKQQTPNELLITEIADRDLGYSGSWTYALVPEGNATRLTITERGEVSNVIFRFMSRFVFGHTATLDKYLAALSARFTT